LKKITYKMTSANCCELCWIVQTFTTSKHLQKSFYTICQKRSEGFLNQFFFIFLTANMYQRFGSTNCLLYFLVKKRKLFYQSLTLLEMLFMSPSYQMRQ